MVAHLPVCLFPSDAASLLGSPNTSSGSSCHRKNILRKSDDKYFLFGNERQNCSQKSCSLLRHALNLLMFFIDQSWHSCFSSLRQGYLMPAMHTLLTSHPKTYGKRKRQGKWF